MAKSRKKIGSVIKLQIPAGQATPAPPLGPALGQAGVNIPEFIKAFNSKTAGGEPLPIPTIITIYKDRSFSFIIKKPPVAILLKKGAKIAKGSGEPNKEKVANVSYDEVRKIAELKMVDMNAGSVEAAMEMVKGTARSMGIVVEEGEK